MRLGIFGGTFDPPHVGHLLAASDAFEALALDRLIFVPAAAQPLKVGAVVARPEERLEMLRLMVGEDARFDVDPIEIHREGLSFTVDTLTAYAERYPDAERYFIAGADVISTFAKWREPARILRLARMAVLTRTAPGEPASDAGIAEGFVVAAGAGEEIAEPVVLSTRRVDVSATEIRARVRDGLSIRGFVTDAVAGYIAAGRLYR